MAGEDGTVIDNVAQSRFELVQDGYRAELVYVRRPHILVLIHTGVPPELRGGGVGGKLVDAAVEDARRTGVKLVVRCPFAKAYLARHPPAGVEHEIEAGD
jgi:predicted GNAT family acetyltransferase